MKWMKRIADKRLSLRFSFFYVVMAGIVILVAMLAYNRIYQEQEKVQRMELLRQSSESVASSIESMIVMIQQNSFSVLGDGEVQTILKTEDYSFTEANRTIRNKVSYWVVALPFVDSVYVFQNGGDVYSMDKVSARAPGIPDVRMADWYPELEELKGYFAVKVNGDYFLKKDGTEASVSFLRIINDLSSFRPLGVLMVNVGNRHLKDTYMQLAKDAGILFYIADENSKLISCTTEESVTNWERWNRGITPKELEQNKREQVGLQGLYMGEDGQEYLVYSAGIRHTDWHVTAALPVRSGLGGFQVKGGYFLILLFAMGIVFVFSFLLMVIEVAHPISQMVRAMDSADGKLTKMAIRLPKGELTVMQNKYNELVDRNQGLIAQINKAQRTKRKAEMRVLQEQIKPHFLYNTINAMQYLCMTKKTDELYDALEAFGRFYQLSLSKGRETVTVGEEIEIVENYMRLQKLRYGSEIECVIHAEEEVYERRILKLLLQPLVENSIYHGIKAQESGGLIQVEICLIRDGTYLMLQVEDDGVGMTEAELELVKPESLLQNENSFGLRGTVERIRVFYEDAATYEIESTPGVGTLVRICVPAL